MPLQGAECGIKAKNDAIAATLQSYMRQISGRALWLGLGTSLIIQFDSLINMIRTGAIVAIGVFIVFSFALGYLLGGSGLDTRLTLAVGTAQRNIAAALLTAGSNFDDPAVVSVIVVTSFSMFVVIRLIAKQVFTQTEQVEAS